NGRSPGPRAQQPVSKAEGIRDWTEAGGRGGGHGVVVSRQSGVDSRQSAVISRQSSVARLPAVQLALKNSLWSEVFQLQVTGVGPLKGGVRHQVHDLTL